VGLLVRKSFISYSFLFKYSVYFSFPAKRKTIQKMIFCVLAIKPLPKPVHSTENQINASSGNRSPGLTVDYDP
jgi:hypothetical protein